MAEDTKVSKVVEKLDQTGEYKLDDMVNFQASYPSDYKGVRHMVEGRVYKLHRLHAKRLEHKKVGKVVA